MGCWVNTWRMQMYFYARGKVVKMPSYRVFYQSKRLTPFKKCVWKVSASHALLLRRPTFVLCVYPLSKNLSNPAPFGKMRISPIPQKRGIQVTYFASSDKYWEKGAMANIRLNNNVIVANQILIITSDGFTSAVSA